jgi:uncharacterized protein YndB with AHSA1/START domain
MPADDPSDRELVITRVLDAPRAAVYAAWTDPRLVTGWWGPHGFTSSIREMDVRPGGAWRFIMHGEDGTDYPNRIVYREVVEPERLVYAHGADDPHDPYQFQVTVTFAEQGGRTELTMRTLFASAEECARTKSFGAAEGADETLDRLAALLARMRPRA